MLKAKSSFFGFFLNLLEHSYFYVGVAELVDALGLGPSGETHEGSTPSSDTINYNSRN